MTHANAPLTIEGRRRLVERCRARPIAHVAAEAGVPRACLSKWKSRYDTHGEAGLRDRPSVPRSTPTQIPPDVVERIEQLRRDNKWSTRRITLELASQGVRISEHTVSRWLARLGINQRRFLDPDDSTSRRPKRIVARYPGHLVHLDVKKVGRIPDGGGWRVAGPRSRLRAGQGRTARKDRWRQGRVRLPALRHRQILLPGLHRASCRREGRHHRGVPQPGPRVLRRPRHPPGRARSDRQRREPPCRRLRALRYLVGSPPPADQALRAERHQRHGQQHLVAGQLLLDDVQLSPSSGHPVQQHGTRQTTSTADSHPRPVRVPRNLATPAP